MDSLNIAENVRKKALILTSEYKASHIGSILSIVDIMAVLYSKVFQKGDKVVLSKGHAGLCQVLTMAECGLIDPSLVETYYNNEGTIGGYRSRFNGVEFLSASLGQGINVGVGFALAQKIKKDKNKTFVIVGNGECNEGSVYEAVMFAVQRKLNNLVVIIDDNKLQAMGKSEEILNLNLEKIFKAFDAKVVSIDGHKHEEIYLSLIDQCCDRPLIIIASTVKGKGVDEMENNNFYHYSYLDDSELKNTIEKMESTSEG